MFVLAIAIIASLAAASLQRPLFQPEDKQLTGLCFNSPNPDTPVCPFNIEPYWYVCGYYNYKEAPDVCAQYGWRQAVLTAENQDILNQIALNCTGPIIPAWLGGVRGLAADPCAFLSPNYGAYLNYGNLYCDIYIVGALCEEIPQVTVSTTSTAFEGEIFTDTTTTTTSYRTRTVSPYEPHCTDCPKPSSSSSSSSCSSSDSWNSSRDSSSSSSSECPHHDKPKSAPICYTGDCLPVCNYSVGGVHLITANVNYTDTAAECAKYGWSVLDFTNGRSFDVFNVGMACSESGYTFARINSFNGVKSTCTLIDIFDQYGTAITGVGFADPDEGWCSLDNALQVFCQEQCPFPVAESGEEVGLLSITTIQSVTFEGFVTATSTSIITTACTETVFLH